MMRRVFATTTLNDTPRRPDGNDLVFDIDYAIHEHGDVRIVRREWRVCGGIELSFADAVELAVVFDRTTRAIIAELQEA